MKNLILLLFAFFLGNPFGYAQNYIFEDGSCYQNVIMSASGSIINGKNEYIGAVYTNQAVLKWNGTQWGIETALFGIDYTNSTTSDPPIDGTWVKVGYCTAIIGPTFTNQALNIEENSIFSGISIFPNPTLDGLVNIKLNGISNFNLKIFNITGQLVFQKNNLNTSNYSFNLDVGAGLYIIELSTKDRKQNFKLIKK